METEKELIELELKGLAQSRNKKKLTSMFSKPDSYELLLNNIQDKDAVVPIIISAVEAQSIAAHIENIQHNPPLTYDLFKLAVDKFGFRLDNIKIHSIDDEAVFHTAITYSKDNQQIKLESRLIDAVALAIRHGGRIFIDRDVYQGCSERLT